jgi:hypothetical protein
VVAVRAGRETIDRELGLLAAIRRACRERGGVLPSIRPVDDIETLWRATSWPDRSGDMAHVVASGDTMLAWAMLMTAVGPTSRRRHDRNRVSVRVVRYRAAAKLEVL